jgi:hypothetical protein
MNDYDKADIHIKALKQLAVTFGGEKAKILNGLTFQVMKG